MFITILKEEKTAQNALKTKLQQERHREKRRQLLQETTSPTKFGFTEMSDLEKQLRVNSRIQERFKVMMNFK